MPIAIAVAIAIIVFVFIAAIIYLCFGFRGSCLGAFMSVALVISIMLILFTVVGLGAGCLLAEGDDRPKIITGALFFLFLILLMAAYIAWSGWYIARKKKGRKTEEC